MQLDDQVFSLKISHAPVHTASMKQWLLRWVSGKLVTLCKPKQIIFSNESEIADSSILITVFNRFEMWQWVPWIDLPYYIIIYLSMAHHLSSIMRKIV